MGSLDDQIVNSSVNLDDFETFVKYAKDLYDYVHFDLLTGRLSQERWSPDETGRDQRGNPFGELEESGRVQRSVTYKRTQITNKVQAIDKALERLLVGMRRIAEEYKTVEELNRLDAKRLNELLSSAAPFPTDPSDQLA